ncbi:MAG: ABC transporter substrate-binding protein, partial [Thermoplasmata archaeon]
MERKKICVLSGAIILSMLVLALLSSPVVIGKSEKTQILRSPPYGGVYKIGMLSDVKNLNPCVANDVYSWYLLDLVYDSLSRPDETQMPVPWVAESWWETTPDHMNLTVRVRQGLSWHDGQPLTADVVVFTYNFLMDVGRYAMALEAIDWTPLPGAIDRNETYYVGVQKVDTYNVSFKLWRPDAAFFLDALGVPLLPKHIWRNHWEDKTTWNMDYNPSTGTANVIGSGPFKFKYWYQGVKASVERNPSYFWQIRLEDGNIYTAPFLDEIQFLLYGNIENALDALNAGNIDYILTPQGLDPSRVPFLAQIPGVKVFTNDYPGYFYLMFNMMLPYQGYDEGTGYQPRGFETDPITYPDPQAGEDAGLPFRKAVAHCIDKEFIVSHLLQGFGVKGDSIVPPFYSFWYNDTLPQYDYNITTAVSILEAANYRDVNGDGWREDYAGRVMDGPNSNGQIDILTLDYDPVRARAGEMIAEALKAAGVKAEAVTTSLGQIVDSVFVYREFEMFILGWRLGLDPIWVYDFFNSKFDWYNSSIGDGGNNVAGYRNQHYDSISAKVMEKMDLATRVALVKECQGMIATHLPTNVLYYKKLIEVADNTEWSGYMEQIGGVGNFWTFLQLHQPVLVPELRVDVKASQPVLEGNAYANLRLSVTALRQDSTPYPNVTVSLALSPSDPEIFLPAQSMLTDANGKAEFLVVVKNNYLAGRIYRAVVSATDGSNNATAETYFEILPAGFVVDVESPRVVVGTANTIFYLNATVTQSGTPVQGAQVEIQALYPSTNLQIVNTRGNTDENGRV